MGCGPPKVMKIGLGPATPLLGSATLPFVISTEVERSAVFVHPRDTEISPLRYASVEMTKGRVTIQSRRQGGG
jgi:hypothetical protein